MSDSSRLSVIKNLPYDIQVEIVENEFRKDFTESEKANIQKMLRKYFEKLTKPGLRNDLKKPKLTSGKCLVEVTEQDNRVNRQIGNIFGESHETVRKREKVFKNIDEKTRRSLDLGEKSLNSIFQEKETKVILFLITVIRIKDDNLCYLLYDH